MPPTATPGDQRWIGVHLQSGPQAIPILARTIRHLFYDPGSDLDRLNDVLNKDSPWKVRGFAEALAVKCLAIVYPDRWLPFFVYPGDSGKKAIMRLLPIPPLNEHGKFQGRTREGVQRRPSRPYEAVLRKRPLGAHRILLVAPELFAMTRSPAA